MKASLFKRILPVAAIAAVLSFASSARAISISFANLPASGQTPASQIARDLLSDLSANLPPDLEGFRLQVEWPLSKLLVKRKEWDEARAHLARLIAYLQPLGDCKSMRDATALLATLDSK